jgi:hypothetical protein
MFDAWLDPTEVRRVVCFFACAGISLSSLEWLLPWWQLDRNGLLAPGLADAPRGFAGRLRRLWRPTVVRLVIALRLLCGVWFCVSVLAAPHHEAGAAALLAALLSLPLRVRDPVGVLTAMDGPEHLLTSTLLVLGTTYFLSSTLALQAALVSVAGQALLEYVGAGWTKLQHWRAWASGRHLQEIFASSSYGNRIVAAQLANHPAVGGLVSLGVIALELVVPFSLLLHAPFAEILLAAVLAFHVTAAATMGLNTFVWAYVATYPAILHLRDLIIGA